MPAEAFLAAQYIPHQFQLLMGFGFPNPFNETFATTVEGISYISLRPVRFMGLKLLKDYACSTVHCVKKSLTLLMTALSLTVLSHYNLFCQQVSQKSDFPYFTSELSTLLNAASVISCCWTLFEAFAQARTKLFMWSHMISDWPLKSKPIWGGDWKILKPKGRGWGFAVDLIL